MASTNKNDPNWFPVTVSTEREVDGDEKWRDIMIKSTRDQLKCIAKSFGLSTTGTKEILLTSLLNSPEVSEEHAQARDLYGREWGEDTHEGYLSMFVHDENHVRIGANTLEEAKLLAVNYPWCDGITQTNDLRYQEFVYHLGMGSLKPATCVGREASWLKN